VTDIPRDINYSIWQK